MSDVKFSFALKAGNYDVGELRIYDVIGEGFFGGGISSESVAKSLDGFKGKSLHVYVNSPGGNAYDGIAIYNAIKRFPGEKVVHVDGLAASAASLIAMAGDRIVTAPNAMWMIHEASTFVGGNAAALRKRADAVEKLSDGYCDTYCRRTGQSAEDVRRWMADETWMNAAEAKARGFTDEISDEEPETVHAENSAAAAVFAQFAKAPAEAARFLNLAPAAPKAAESGKEPKMKNLLKQLGLAENATEAEAMAAVEKMQGEASAASAERSAMLSATGEADVRSACATIAGLKEKAASAAELQAKFAALEVERKQTEIAKLLDEATADGRLTPAKRARITGEEGEPFNSDPVSLRKYLNLLDKPAPAPREPEVKAPEVKAWAEMSNVERAAMYASNREQAEKLKAESEKK